MNKMYLRDYAYDSVEGRVMAHWNSGSSLSQAATNLCSWYGFTKEQIIPIWRRLWREHGCAPVPLFLSRPETSTDPEYLEWKGITGPGKLLREIVKETNK